MEYTLRRGAVRRATAMLCGAGLAVGALLAVDGRADGRDAAPILLSDVAFGVDDDLLDIDTGYVHRALDRDRVAAGLRRLTLDADLVASARRDACAIARGDLPLAGDADRRAAAGAHRENVGLAIDGDPVSGARTMHAWWATTPGHRSARMDAAMGRYGIGSCADGDRRYFVERLAP